MESEWRWLYPRLDDGPSNELGEWWEATVAGDWLHGWYLL